MQACFPDVYAYRLLFIFRYTMAALEGFDFLDEVFSFEFFLYGHPRAHPVNMYLVLVRKEIATVCVYPWSL